MSAAGGGGLRQSLTRAGVLLAGGAIGGRLVQAAAYALLARLLVPADFGAMALAAVAINALQLLPGLGLGTALLAREADPRPLARHAAGAALLGGGAVALLAGAIAAVVASRGEAVVARLIVWLGVALLVQAPGAVAGALLDRELRFGARVAADLLGAGAFLATGVVAALLGAGADSLALGLVASALVQSGMLLHRARLRPALRPDFAALRATSRLGAVVLATALLQWLFTSGDVAWIERRFGRDAVGCYAAALQLALVPASALGVLSGRLALPALVRARASGGGGDGFRQASALAAILAAAACATLVVGAAPIVALLWGERFAAATPLLPLLAIGAFAKVLGGLAGPALLASGRARVALLLVLGQNAIALPAAALVPAGFGAAGVAAVYAGVQVAACLTAFAIGARGLALPGATVVRAALLPLAAVLSPALLLGWLAPAGGAWLGLALGLALLAALAARERRGVHREALA